MAEIAIIFHSGYGHTLRMAQAVAEGAKGQLIPIDAEGTLDGPKHIIPIGDQ
jgi:flavodoxin